MTGSLFLSLTNTIVRTGEWMHRLRWLGSWLKRDCSLVLIDFWKTGIRTVFKWSLNDWFVAPAVAVIEKWLCNAHNWSVSIVYNRFRNSVQLKWLDDALERSDVVFLSCLWKCHWNISFPIFCFVLVCLGLLFFLNLSKVEGTCLSAAISSQRHDNVWKRAL